MTPMQPPERIASLLPAATEIVCALGLGDRLVLRSHECDHPESVSRLPHATRPRAGPDGTSYGIDERIRALLQEGLSVYRVDADVLRAAAPQAIVTQDQCEVCAVPLDEIREAAERFLDPAPMIVSLGATDLGGILDDVRRVAEALGVPESGFLLAGELRAGIQRAIRALRGREDLRRPRVLAIEWLDPLMVAGNWVPELIELAGGEALVAEPGRHSPFVEWEKMLAADPDVILVLPCGFSIERSRAELSLLSRRPGWAGLRAVREGQVAILDGHHYFNRPGPRVVDSLEILVEVFHPALVPVRHEGSGWMWWRAEAPAEVPAEAPSRRRGA